MSQASIELQQELQAFQIGNFSNVALLVLVFYEYVITIDQEIACVWQRKVTAASALLLSTRWVMVVYQGYNWVTPSNVSEFHCCRRLGPPDNVILWISFAQLALFSGLRVYALWRESRFRLVMCAVVVALGLVQIGTNLYAMFRTQTQYVGAPFFSCSWSVDVPEDLNTM
ncbi:hypothetical protein PsYK624_145940 [Phanerochaete sordida]|uniref:DUF6533 domain-containing protein n=1 Tax=Phanerochaete sordida TaxID=48140 RepID=A0A9P3LKH9_9APHY|nr:hypothetical protein PsYK624_145940 [Phanerochaete sordida]